MALLTVYMCTIYYILFPENRWKYITSLITVYKSGVGEMVSVFKWRSNVALMEKSYILNGIKWREIYSCYIVTEGQDTEMWLFTIIEIFSHGTLYRGSIHCLSVTMETYGV